MLLHDDDMPMNSVRSLAPLSRKDYYPSPENGWQDQVLYFLLPDRFSDGNEMYRQLLDRSQLNAMRGASWSWKAWSDSGRSRWQGGNIKGILSKVPYLADLGVTALWIGPVFKQRSELDTFHGYAIQTFLEKDLIDLVATAHQSRIRVIQDVIFHHSGVNWTYNAPNPNTPPYRPYDTEQYRLAKWLDSRGQATLTVPIAPNDGVWPSEFQHPGCYMRAGVAGSLDGKPTDDPDNGTLPYRRGDFPPDGLRTFLLTAETLSALALCFKRWIALTDCDGFRIDTVKHVTADAARAFCGAIKEYAVGLGKLDFFLVAEIGGGDGVTQAYLEQIDRTKLNAALDIGQRRVALRQVAKGLSSPREFFYRYIADPPAGESRQVAERLVSCLDDHDNIGLSERLRFSAGSTAAGHFGASSDHQVVAGVAIQLFTLSIPCIYYGTEQAFSYHGPDADQIKFLLAENWGNGDHFLREAMFGPLHPRVPGIHGLGEDAALPGFGPFGTSGYHYFDKNSPAYIRIRHLIEVRKSVSTLRRGRQYQRQLGSQGWDNLAYGGGGLIAWSRILDDREVLCFVNGNGEVAAGDDILVDANLNPPGSSFRVIANTAESFALAGGKVYTGPHAVGSSMRVNRRSGSAAAFVSLQPLGPSEVLVVAAANAF